MLVTYGHPGGVAVGIEEYIGYDARLREGHILYGPQLAADTLLSCSTRKLIPYYRVPLQKRNRQQISTPVCHRIHFISVNIHICYRLIIHN